MLVKSGLDTAGAAEVSTNSAHAVPDGVGVQDETAVLEPQ